ncbi:retropepsin-like aspartic protease [Marinobacterium marinum]|uniref:Clan AA aspartic protease n=1 Tax=Marinobacterium marinum TaxID=2756129 RepID=A0A7W1WW40_9GAMM|nr:retropepsin-like aspartic protease [Marinobacterium marinum]MBA4501289.1 clan AA aspartic protease [Marinobacterium marinum]
MNRKTLVTMMALVATPLWTTSVSAEIYHYVDHNGRKIYVDRQSQIPPEYRDQMTRLKEESQTLSRSERARREQVLQRLEASKGTLGEMAAIEAEMASLEQRAMVKGNSVQVPVELRYQGKRKTVNLIVDTGATRTLLHKSTAKSLGAALRPGGHAQVVGGARIPTSLMPVDGLSFGPVDQGKSELLIIEPSVTPGYDGLLGMDILGKLKYEIDLERQVVIWHADRYRELARTRQELQARMNAESTP